MSRVESPPLTLPKGGESLGLQEAFLPDVATGVEHVRVPVALTPGRFDFTPDLHLQYSVQGGNSPFGWGWQLNLPVIARDTRGRVPRYDPTDTFTLGGEELLPNGGQLWTRRFERPFERIEALAPDPTMGWRVTGQDNRTTLFGVTAQARVVDPQDNNRVFSWHPELSFDDRGNLMHYEYKRDPTPRGASVALLKRVRYGNRRPWPLDSLEEALRAARGEWRDAAWLFTCLLDYGEHGIQEGQHLRVDQDTPTERHAWPQRDDTTFSGSAGFEVYTRRACRRFLMLHQGDDGSPQLVRSTDLQLTPRASDGALELTRVVHRGYLPADLPEDVFSEDVRHSEDGIVSRTHQVQSTPPLSLSYEPTTLTDGTSQPLSCEGAQIPSDPIGAGDVTLVDVLGRGIPDILESGREGHRWWRNRGNGTFDAPQPLADAPPLALSNDRVGLFDLTGQLRPDWVKAERGNWQVWHAAAPGRWAPPVKLPNSPAFPLTVPGLKFIDLSGDGRMDLLVADGARTQVFEFVEDQGFVEQPSANMNVPKVHFQDPFVVTADLNGDGLTDIVRLQPGKEELLYWPSLGHGHFGAAIRVPVPGLGPYEPEHLFLVGLSGGAADLVLVERSQIRVWFNRGGGAFGEPNVVHTDVPDTAGTRLFLTDLYGTGQLGVLYVGGRHFGNVRFVPLVRGPARQLREVCSGVGLRVEYNYVPSTVERLREEAQGRRWWGHLPVSTPVLKRTVKHDETTGRAHETTFEYAHGHYDRHDKRFAGFGRVDRVDVDLFEASGPGTLTRAWYHTGAVLADGAVTAHFEEEFFRTDRVPRAEDEFNLQMEDRGPVTLEARQALRGQPLRTETYEQGAQVPLRVSSFAYCARSLGHGATFVYPCGETRRDHDGHPDDPRVIRTLTLGVDTWGHPLDEIRIGCPRVSPPNDAPPAQRETGVTLTLRRYAHHHDALALRAGCVTEVQQFVYRRGEQSGGLAWATAEAWRRRLHEHPPSQDELLNWTRHTYTTDGTTSLPPGSCGPRALPFQTTTCLYSARTVEQQYAEVFPTDELQKAGLQLMDEHWWAPGPTTTYDPSNFFVPVRVTDAFGATTATQYDDFGLFPSAVTDALGNVTTAILDRRVLRITALTDANGTRSEVAFDALGRVAAAALFNAAEASMTLAGMDVHPDRTVIEHLLEQPDRDAPRLLGNADVRFVYDAWRHAERGGGTSYVRVARDLERPQDVQAPPVELVFLDGVGEPRVTLEHHPGGPGNPWVAQGTRARDRFGQDAWIVAPHPQREPTPSLTPSAATTHFQRDALGRPTSTRLPHATTRVEYHAWYTVHWDETDTDDTSLHHATPTIRHLDPLGQVVQLEENNGTFGLLHTRMKLDALGRLMEQRDPRGGQVERHTRDFLGHSIDAIRQDAGRERVLRDVNGRVVLTADSRGHTLVTQYDPLGRPRLHLTRTPEGRERVTAFTAYGESHPQGERLNLRGRVWFHLDSAGLESFTYAERGYDHRGQPSCVTRRFLRGEEPADWEAARTAQPSELLAGLDQAGVLEPETYVRFYRHDALGRLTYTALPDTTVITTDHDRAGRYVRIDVRRGERTWRVLRDVQYNARGQAERQSLGEHLLLERKYHSTSFRLTELVVKQGGAVAQHLTVDYDAIGNPLRWSDPNGHVPGAPCDATYTYDALHRIVEARGREHPAQLPPPAGLRPKLHPNDHQALRTYVEQYEYDESGNLIRLAHHGAGDWVRQFSFESESNRLITVGAPAYGTAVAVTHDADGHLTRLQPAPAGTPEQLTWTAEGYLARADLEGGGHATYDYDVHGQRVRKRIYRGAFTEETLYLGPLVISRRVQQGSPPPERHELYVDGHGHLLARLEQDGDTAHLRCYAAAHHLTPLLACDEDAGRLTRVEYTPYGEVSFSTARSERLQYAGKELDEETGFSCFGARYYASWWCRWVTPDPSGTVDTLNLYCFARDNPVRYTDPDGRYAMPEFPDEPPPRRSPTTQAADGSRQSTPADRPQSKDALNGSGSAAQPGQPTNPSSSASAFGIYKKTETDNQSLEVRTVKVEISKLNDALKGKTQYDHEGTAKNQSVKPTELSVSVQAASVEVRQYLANKEAGLRPYVNVGFTGASLKATVGYTGMSAGAEFMTTKVGVGVCSAMLCGDVNFKAGLFGEGSIGYTQKAGGVQVKGGALIGVEVNLGFNEGGRERLIDVSKEFLRKAFPPLGNPNQHPGPIGRPLY